MNKLIESILEIWLPAKWPRLIMGASITLATSLFAFPEKALKAVQIEPTETVTLLTKYSATSWLLLVGLALTHYLVVKDHRAYNPQNDNTGTETIDNTLLGILSLIAKYHSQEIPAAPKRIADDLNIDPGILLAHMVKYNNEQYITRSETMGSLLN